MVFFWSSLGFFESIFWRRTVSRGIPHEAGTVRLYTTSEILRLQLQYTLICICLLWGKLIFGLEDSSDLPLEVRRHSYLLFISENRRLLIPLSVKACRMTDWLFSRFSG